MAFHLFRINEIYANASGTIQFVELVAPANGEHFWAGVALSTTSGGVTRTFTFPTNLPSSATANRSVLVATAGFAAVAGVTPDFVIPDGFLFAAGGSLNFGNVHIVNYPALPTNGTHSVDRNGVAAVATPQNFAGNTGALPPAGPPTITGTAGNDTLTGTGASEIIEGLGGSDTLRTGGGNDTLRGGAGDDALHSGPGNDTIDGGEGFDYLYYSEASSGVTIDLRTGAVGGGAGSDTVAAIELIFGSPFADTFVGNDLGVGFLGGAGNDVITGGAARDHLEGNEGDDTIDGLGGTDVIAYYSAAGPVTVNLGAGAASGGLGNDTLRNVEDVVGSVFGDTLIGTFQNNVLDGSEGNDTLVSTAGDDTLMGGTGIDTAVYAGARGTYTLQVRPVTASAVTTVEKPNAGGVDSLPVIERLQFADVRVALDLEGHAGQTAKLLGAVFGRTFVANRQYVGIGLSMLDGGTSYEQLAALAVSVTGRTAPADVVALLWTNVVGAPPTAAQAAPFVSLLNGGMSVGALTVAAAEHALNLANIDFVGLERSGIEFLPA